MFLGLQTCRIIMYHHANPLQKYVVTVKTEKFFFENKGENQTYDLIKIKNNLIITGKISQKPQPYLPFTVQYITLDK